MDYFFSWWRHLHWRLVVLLAAVLFITQLLVAIGLLSCLNYSAKQILPLTYLPSSNIGNSLTVGWLSSTTVVIAWKSLVFLGGGLVVFWLVILLAAAYFLGRWIFNPLLRLQNGLNRVAQGELGYTLTFERYDELGQVIAAFNGMTGHLSEQRKALIAKSTGLEIEVDTYQQTLKALQEVHHNLQDYNQLLVQILEVGRSLQRNLNPNSLFQEIVEAVHTLLGFGMVVFSLVEEGGKQMRVRAFIGLDQEARQLVESTVYAWEDFVILLQERFRVGTCYFIPGDALEHTPSSLVSDLNDPYGRSEMAQDRWQPDDALFLPIESSPGQIEGMFSLGQPLNGCRPNSETFLALELFGGHAATAIQNARLYDQIQQDLIERKRAAEALKKLNEELEDRVKARTSELTRTNESLRIEIAERQRAEEQIKASLKEKEVLLKEIHHRVKNNLQVISSLLNLQLDYVNDPEMRQIFQESQNRVRSMALVHESLYRSHDLARINLGNYIENLATSLFNSYRSSRGRITLNIQAEPVTLGIDAAVPCGLMLNELISNALKHAFPDDRSGEIRINLRENEDRQVYLIVGDNGTGFPANFNFETATSLGMQLVDTLVRQLNGQLEISSENGSEFRITFSVTS